MSKIKEGQLAAYLSKYSSLIPICQPNDQPGPIPISMLVSEYIPVVVPAINAASLQYLELADLESFFSGFIFPIGAIHLTPWEQITNPSAFVRATIESLKHNVGSKSFGPYYQRLVNLKAILTNQQP